MIGFLTGKIISKKPTQVLLDANGVGYLLNISVNTFEKLAGENEIISLYTYLSVKEDSLDLFGFFTQTEKEMFKLLISVSGIGPKLGQNILSGITIEELQEALQMGNLSRIMAVPGIGRKTAERLMIELRDKVGSLAEEYGMIPKSATNVKIDAISALTSLGYNLKTAERTIRKILDTNPQITIENLIKEALSELNK